MTPPWLKCRVQLAILFVAAGLLAPPSVRAQIADPCWTPIELPSDTMVEIRAADEQKDAKVVFVSPTAADLQTIDRKPLATAEPETEVRLAGNTGQIVLRKGPLWLVRDQVAYTIPNAGVREHRLAAQAGTRLKLNASVTDGKLPAATEARVLLDSEETVLAKLTAPLDLTPATPDRATGWLDAGSLPLTRGGRTMTVTLYAPTRSANELKSENFQACFNTTPAFVTVASAQDGVAQLLVRVPDQVVIPDKVFEGIALWDSASLRLLGAATGIFADSIYVRIGNPILSAIVSIVVGLLILFIPTYFIKKQEPKTQDPTITRQKWTLPRLFVGQDGEPSLSLFQMYLWTWLVLTGMFYVFFMSGNLLNVTEQVLILLGLAGLSTISSRFVGAGAAGSTPGTGKGFWGMFLVGGKPDLLRLQMFIFTFAIWFYVATRVFYEQAFPVLDANVLLLMGISNGVYVGAKWAASGNPLAELNKRRLEMDTAKDIMDKANKKYEEAKETEKSLPNEKQIVTKSSFKIYEISKEDFEKKEQAYKEELQRLTTISAAANQPNQ